MKELREWSDEEYLTKSRIVKCVLSFMDEEDENTG